MKLINVSLNFLQVQTTVRNVMQYLERALKLLASKASSLISKLMLGIYLSQPCVCVFYLAGEESICKSSTAAKCDYPEPLVQAVLQM